MTPMTPACMGGFCKKRDRCGHYWADDRNMPSERLCEPGADGVGMEAPVRLHATVGTWERISVPDLFCRAQPFDALQAVA